MKRESQEDNQMVHKDIMKDYQQLQTAFKEIQDTAKEQKHKGDLRTLKKLRKSIVNSTTKYSQNPENPKHFIKLRNNIIAGKNILEKIKANQLKINQTLNKKPSKNINSEEKTNDKENQEKPSSEKIKEKPSEKEKNHGSSEETIRQGDYDAGNIFEKTTTKAVGKVIESYDIEVDRAEIEIKIRENEFGKNYELVIPQIDVATRALLDNIRDELISATTVSMKELTDPKAFTVVKERFMGDSERILEEKLPAIEKGTKNFLVGKLMQDMLGLGEIEYLINDPNLEEIVIPSSKEPVKVYIKKYGWLSTNLRIPTEDKIVNYANIIARRVGRQITVLTPLLDAHLISGDRINAVLYPINTKGNTITIRKFARDPYTIIDLINNKTCDIDTATLLWLAVEYEMNVLISGGTASGKTVFLNACMSFIPPNHRIISIEDTRELMLPEFLYWSPLTTRTANPEGKGEVSMLDLLVNSLRMRPDRIILGEIRRHQEAMVLFEAMHTGHSVYATVHADSAAETISRLVNPPINVPPNLLKAVNLNVVMFRDRRRGIRRILQMSEIEAEGDRARANILYRWSAEEDKIIRHRESSTFFEDVSRHTGLNQTKLNQNLEEKKKILLWLLKNKIRSLEDFGKVMNYYYLNKEMLIKLINKNDIKSILGKVPLKQKETNTKKHEKKHKA